MEVIIATEERKGDDAIMGMVAEDMDKMEEEGEEMEV